MIAALLLAVALGDCLKPTLAPPAAKPVAPATHIIIPNVHRKARKRSLIKPLEPNCDEITTSIVEMFVIPPEVPPEMLFTPVPETVPTWPADETPTPVLLDGCECFGRFIGDASGAAGGGGGMVGGDRVRSVPASPAFVAVAPIPEPSTWAMLVAGVAVLAYRRKPAILKRKLKC